MKFQLFSIFDSKANVFHAPFAAVNADVAMRQFEASASDLNSLLYKFPSDFSLFHVGDFDDGNGTVQALEEFVNLGQSNGPARSL